MIMNSKLLNTFFSVLTSERMDWHRTWNPWSSAHNPFTWTIYTWFNSYLNYIGSRFATFNQISAAKGKIKQGAKGLPVLYCMFVEETDDKWIKHQEYKGQRYYIVFNIDTDVEWLSLTEQSSEEHYQPFELLDSYRKKETIDLQLWQPSYHPISDVIKLPNQSDFFSYEEYQSVYAHECVHSTGHSRRLNRPLIEHKYWSPGYAQEELVAEIGAVMLTGNHVSDNTKAYIQWWVMKASNDKDSQKVEIYKAFQKARDAVQYIQGPTKTDSLLWE